MIVLLTLWALVFVTRVVLFTLYGWDFVYSSANITLIFVSGTLVGLIIRSLVIRKKSVAVNPESLGLVSE